MKQKVSILAALLLCTMQGWSNPNFQFCDTTSLGHALYYNIVDGTAHLVAPWTNGSGSVGWDEYPRPVGNLVIPDSVTYNDTTYAVTSIDFAAFCFCRGITSITFPSTLTQIGNNAFWMCDALYSQTIPNTVTSIGNNAFGWVPMVFYTGEATGAPWGAFYVNGYIEDSVYYTSSSKDTLVALYFYVSDSTFTIPSTVTVIGPKAFNSMTNLTSVTLPASVLSIGAQAFEYCTSLTEINSEARVAPTVEDNTFTNVQNIIPVNIPCGSMGSYLSRWSYFSNFIEGEGFSFSATSADETMGSVSVLTQPTCTAPQAVVYAVANEGYRFDHWSDGNTDNPRSLTVTQDTAIIGYFVSTEGIDDVDGLNAKVFSANGRLVVEGADGLTVTLFDATGRTLAIKQSSNQTITFDIPASGTYLVKVGSAPARRIVVIK